KEESTKEDVSKENADKEETSTEDANKVDEVVHNSTTSTKIVVCILLTMFFTIGAYMIAHTIYIRKKRVK
ncbi:MAG: hypothetical protein IKW45_08865, partial [Clostridia bacterium]|nr:hypothetical protein [Clostridia bacterium]